MPRLPRRATVTGSFRSPHQMRRVRAALAAVVVVTTAAAGVAVGTTDAFAYVTTTGGGTVAAGIGTLNAPSNVTVPASTSSPVHVTWTGVSPPAGATAVGYWVRRYQGATATDACSSSRAAPIQAGTGSKSCDDTVAPGTYTYTVTSVWRSWSSESGASGSVTVGGNHFSVTAPTSATAGASFTVTVTALDGSNTKITSYGGRVHFTSSDPAASLPADYTFKTSGGGKDNGDHDFTVTLKTAGAQTITVTDTVTSSMTGSDTVAVNGASLDHFVVAAPATATAGTAFTATVQALDTYGNAASGWTSTNGCVVFSGPGSSPAGTAPIYPARGSCSSGQSGLAFDATGEADATITLPDAGSTTLTATSNGKTGSGSLVVNAAAPSRLAWTHVSPSSSCLFSCSATALFFSGGTWKANVSVTDAFGNTVSDLGAGHTVTVTGTGGGTFSAPGSGSTMTLTFPSTGAADSTVRFTYDVGGTDTLTATTASGTTYTSATASLKLFF